MEEINEILQKLPISLTPRAKRLIVNAMLELSIKEFEKGYSKGVECLQKSLDV